MKRFIIKIILFSIPLLIPVFFYVITDPFKVIYTYPEQINTSKNYQIAGNRDFQSTELFLSNYSKYNYNSFILGNSRSMFYQTKTWNKYITGIPFHFNASAESLYGINCKLNLLNELNVDIKNVIIVMDGPTLKITKNSKGHLFIKHPRLSHEPSLMFQYEMFNGFFPKATFAFMDLYLTGNKKDYMELYGVKNNVWKHDTQTNQLTYYVYDKQLAENTNLYYADKMKAFFKRDTTLSIADPVIGDDQKIILKNIISILKAHKTNYRIVINPIYNQIKLNPQDLIYLKEVFGNEYVFDFSGINSFTRDYHNYYEASHYRPFICDSIMQIIYTSKSQ